MAWLGAVAKLVPVVAEVAMHVIPHFTRPKGGEPAAIEDKAAQQQQIAELQQAATQNAEHIRNLASDLKDALFALEQGGQGIEQRLKRLETVAYAALAASILSLIATLALSLH
jgi:hypothetical protein